MENRYLEPDLRYIETSRFELRREKEQYHKEQLEQEEAETDKFTSLVESIRTLGILQPIYVLQLGAGRFEVVDGGRRLRAAKFLGLHRIPAMVYQGENAEPEILKRSLIANIHRKDLEPEEKGEGLAEYYRTGNVDPEHAISYLNTLRQRRQKGARNPGAFPTNANDISRELGRQNPEEYARFLDLHKKLGIPRMTQYEWLGYVVWVNKDVRNEVKRVDLPKGDRKVLVTEGLRNRPQAQKEVVQDLADINKEIERAKVTEKKDIVKFRVSEIKEKKRRKLKEFQPTKQQKRESAYFKYGSINGAISRLWTELTGQSHMPLHTDDIMLDFIKPTRDEFKEYIATISKEERTQQYNWLTWLETAIDDRMKLLDKATK